MYLQVINQSKDKHNQIQSNKLSLFSDIKRQGWSLSDCKVSEIRSELIETKYRGVDGKTIAPGKKQYKSRARSVGSLNVKPTVKVQSALAIVD